MAMLPPDSDLVLRRAPGSFRDPEGRVFCSSERVIRVMSSAAYEVLEQCQQRGLLGELIRKGWLVDTALLGVAPAEISATVRKRWPKAVEHKRVESLSWPMEWTVSMLADAGVLTLDLQLALLNSGFALKDASAYNVQWQHGRPVFVDVGSLERPTRFDVWYALGQFHRMFTFPLLLAAQRGWDPRSYFLGAADGRSEEAMLRAWNGLSRWRPSLLLDVTLPGVLARREVSSKATRARVHSHASAVRGQVANLRRVRRKIARLAAAYSPAAHWAHYSPGTSYSGAEASKREIVARLLEALRPKRVVDVGSNTGEFSYLAEALGCDVIAVDASHDAVEVLYRRLRREPARIMPMVTDIACPTPGFGLHNRERASFYERIQGDCVLALALTHHLVVSAGLSLSQVRDVLHRISSRWLILEAVLGTDPMVEQLQRHRRHSGQPLTMSSYRNVFGKSFRIVSEERIAKSSRHILLCERISRV